MPATRGVPIAPAVFGYIRVSQAEGASGLATQSRILTAHGLRDDRIFTDVASGRNMRRPAWQQLRGKLHPGDVVVVPRIDRLARNLTEGLRAIEELHAQGIHIRSLAEGRTRGRPRALDSEKLQAVRDFLANGGLVSAAARAFGVSRPTVRAVKDGTYAD